MAKFIPLVVKGETEIINIEKIIRVRPINGGQYTRVYLDTFSEPPMMSNERSTATNSIDSSEPYIDVVNKIFVASGDDPIPSNV